MALRTPKISSEIIQTCHKLFSTAADVTARTRIPSVALHNQKDQIQPERHFRYRLGNAKKSEVLPEITFEKDETTVLFADLQPSATPEFTFDFHPPKWTGKMSVDSPFPETLKSKAENRIRYTDQQKAEDKILKSKMTNFNLSSRHMSTNCIRHYSKGPAENSGEGTCVKKVGKCAGKGKTKSCKLGAAKRCPRFKILSCEQSKGSNCKLNYLDPNCTKKFAPYPSYSEACAENLPDDPSECQQCPWRTCDGADTIEPGKPVRNRRNYSTSCTRHLDATAGVVVGPLSPPPIESIQEYLVGGKCGQTKKPCKQPPGPCEVRRQKEQMKKDEKNPLIPKNKKKALEDVNKMVLRSDVCQVEPLSIRSTIEEPVIINQSSWIDIPEGEMLLNKKSKHPNCKKNKKPKRPDDANIDAIANKNEMILSNKGGPKKRKGDEAHPPPCQDITNNSLNCPEKPIKKPKYKKRPMEQGYYKNPEDPYTKSNGK